jgi:hypothetical protein
MQNPLLGAKEIFFEFSELVTGNPESDRLARAYLKACDVLETPMQLFSEFLQRFSYAHKRISNISLYVQLGDFKEADGMYDLLIKYFDEGNRAGFGDVFSQEIFSLIEISDFQEKDTNSYVFARIVLHVYNCDCHLWY